MNIESLFTEKTTINISIVKLHNAFSIEKDKNSYLFFKSKGSITLNSMGIFRIRLYYKAQTDFFKSISLSLKQLYVGI